MTDQIRNQLVDELNHPVRAMRSVAARTLGDALRAGVLSAPPLTAEVNNHVHTCYSFSPYTPTAAAWHARQAGLMAVGVMDHDSIAGAEEMLEAGAALGIATTAGCEIRVRFADTPFSDRLINGPGLTGIAYMAIHGIPRHAIPSCAEFLRPLQEARNRRNRAMVDRLNIQLTAQGIPALNFDSDVYARSCAAEGGSITERHILAALSLRFMDLHQPGPALVEWLEGLLAITLPGSVRGYLLDAANPHYMYDLLGLLKAYYTDTFFIHPDGEECVDVREAVAFAESIGAIPAYAYLGDVSESPTGDKKAEHFEDSFLDELMEWLKRLGFRAITYMPPRNTVEQLARISDLCNLHGFMQISGVDINSSRQRFNCPEILDPRFERLITATWALIGHEKLSSVWTGRGMFSRYTERQIPVLEDRLAAYARIGRMLNVAEPFAIPAAVPTILAS